MAMCLNTYSYICIYPLCYIYGLLYIPTYAYRQSYIVTCPLPYSYKRRLLYIPTYIVLFINSYIDFVYIHVPILIFTYIVLYLSVLITKCYIH